ncbi:MAG TPA: transposase [Chloroflexia bacterium]|nr:transposase [Chloroflexia bacterium]
MIELPATMQRVLESFAPLFRPEIWKRARLLLIGAILCPGTRTVSAALRVLGLAQERHFQNYHRILNRVRWSAREASRILLLLLVAAFVPQDQPLIVAIDETLERRRGKKIAAKGLYRDAVRSSRSVLVKSHGLRWISLMLLAPIPWASRIWALPFLTLLVPSERYCQERGIRYKRLSHWGRQAILLLRRWIKERKMVVVGDQNYSAIELLNAARRVRAHVVVRLRMDAALYDPAPSPEEFRKRYPRGRLPKKGARQPTPEARLHDPDTRWQMHRVRWYGGEERDVEIATGTAVWFHNGLPPVPVRWVLVRDPEGKFDPVCLVCNEQDVTAQQIVEWFVLRWQEEVTFQEVRAHLGVETQRQWSEPAIARTTPVLMGLYSLTALLAHADLGSAPLPVRRAAWYHKQSATFSDTLAWVRQRLWPATINLTSQHGTDVVIIPRALLERFTDTLAFAA